MSDRTQTLLVEAERLLDALDRRVSDARLALDPEMGAVREDTARERIDQAETNLEELRAALLSQPEHQGDEETERIVARIVSAWLLRRGAEIRSGEPMTGTPNGIAQEILAALPAQPPAPVLSDRERERLLDIATGLSLSKEAVVAWAEQRERAKEAEARAERAETALEELAEELDDEAAFEDRQAGRGELDERYRERCAARSATNEKAASQAREKAAKLKGGGES